jgi:DNA-directed RNA polymerase specialized sigma24 family protein
MEPTATADWTVSGADDPIQEIHDFDRVVQQYWPRVLRFILAAVRDADIAETLTQDCFWKAYRSRNAFRGESSLNTWLMRIAVNHAQPAVSVLAQRGADVHRHALRAKRDSRQDDFSRRAHFPQRAGAGRLGSHAQSFGKAADGLPPALRRRHGHSGDRRGHGIDRERRERPSLPCSPRNPETSKESQ